MSKGSARGPLTRVDRRGGCMRHRIRGMEWFIVVHFDNVCCLFLRLLVIIRIPRVRSSRWAFVDCLNHRNNHRGVGAIDLCHVRRCPRLWLVLFFDREEDLFQRSHGDSVVSNPKSTSSSDVRFNLNKKHFYNENIIKFKYNLFK